MVTEKMIEALKPCPFCGYALTTSEGVCEGHVEDSDEEDVEFTGICCPGCAVFLPKQTEDGTAIEGIQTWNRRAEAGLSRDAEPVAEKERLRFEGDLDKWMKTLGAGITGYQPEAYAVMDLACLELVKLRALSTDAKPVKMRVSEEMVEAAHRYICWLYPYPQSEPETRQMLQEAWNVAALSAQVQDVADLDTRMKSAGMYTIAEMMGVTPLTKWKSNPAINTIEAFSEWLDRKVSEYLSMKAGYDLGDKSEDDDLFEWVLAHAGVFSTIRDQFQVVTAAPAAKLEGKP